MESTAELSAPSDTPKNQHGNWPISRERLEQVVVEACDNTLQFADSYQHSLVGTWNTNIIQSALSLLIKESTTYKYIVTSTIVQHTTPPAPLEPKPSLGDNSSNGTENKSGESDHKIGRRGLHSATGAYWNNEKDGTWSFQYKGAEKKGFDVIATIFWVATA